MNVSHRSPSLKPDTKNIANPTLLHKEPKSTRHGNAAQSERAFSVVSTFMSGVMAISASQIMGAPLRLLDTKTYNEYMAWTKENFAVLMTSITEWWAPTVIRVSGGESMKDQLYQMNDGSLRCNFPHRIILMANHQLYTDWLYVWWIAYTNRMHGHVYIVLKEALKQVPVIGWGMRLFNFIFINRNWEHDQHVFKQSLGRLGNSDPAWLIIFPEGTNLASTTREISALWAKKTGTPDMKHQLLPRVTGLQFCLNEMHQTMNWLYDATIAYEGVPKGVFGQDVYTLRSSFLEGRPPKSVNIFWRRYKISGIPYKDKEIFTRWLINRWREKDYMLEYFNKFGKFPAGDALQALTTLNGQSKPVHAKAITTQVKGGGWNEFQDIFGPVSLAAGAVSEGNVKQPFSPDQLLEWAWSLGPAESIKISERERRADGSRESAPSVSVPAASKTQHRKKASRPGLQNLAVADKSPDVPTSTRTVALKTAPLPRRTLERSDGNSEWHKASVIPVSSKSGTNRQNHAASRYASPGIASRDTLTAKKGFSPNQRTPPPLRTFQRVMK